MQEPASRQYRRHAHVALVVYALLSCTTVRIAAQSSSAPSAEAADTEDAESDEPDIAPTPLAVPPPVQQVPPPVPTPPPLFQFAFKGAVGFSVYAQDTPMLSGNGVGSLLGPYPILADSWLMGGDIRQTRFSFNVRGPELFDAVPSVTIEFEMAGGNQVTTVPAPPSIAVVRDAMGNVVGTTNVPMFTSSPQGDESLLPRLRTAYLEFNWGLGTNVLRLGQFHNLLLAMVSASGAHPATLGYGAGQLGWRAPGITYTHKFRFSEEATLDASLQVNRNSWNDNTQSCAPNMAPPAMNCLPAGVSLGEAGLPQVEARLLLSGRLTESPWPHYAPTLWQLHVVGHWDQKDLSGVNTVAPLGVRDSMTTLLVEAGGKVKLGPLLIAVNGWYGKNAGGVLGMLFQMQGPDKPDVFGFGTWGQAGLSLSRYFSLWGFAGIDRPDRDQALAAGFVMLQNIQVAGMFAYNNGPFMLTLEWLTITTLRLIPGSPATATMPATLPAQVSYRGNQPSVTVVYSF